MDGLVQDCSEIKSWRNFIAIFGSYFELQEYICKCRIQSYKNVAYKKNLHVFTRQCRNQIFVIVFQNEGLHHH